MSVFITMVNRKLYAEKKKKKKVILVVAIAFICYRTYSMLFFFWCIDTFYIQPF